MTAGVLPSPGRYADLTYPQRRAVVERLRSLLAAYAETEKKVTA